MSPKTETAARTICDFMGWPDDGPTWEDAKRLAEKVLGPWRPTEEAPRQGYVDVRFVTTYRWHPYRPGAPKNLLAKRGRWQRATDYGWENAELPQGAEFVPNLPLSRDGVGK